MEDTLFALDSIFGPPTSLITCEQLPPQTLYLLAWHYEGISVTGCDITSELIKYYKQDARKRMRKGATPKTKCTGSFN